MNKPFVLIPTYNEISNIERVLDEVSKALPSATILILDDNSPDLTWKYVEERSKTSKRILLNKSDKKQGIGKAYIRGFEQALALGATHIFQMDADLSHNPEDLPDMLELGKKYDLILGSRYKRGINVINWSMRRVLLSYFANRYVRVVAGVNLSDATSGFKCFSRTVLESIDLKKIISDGYVFQVEMSVIASKLGFSIYEKSIVFRERAAGFSKMASGIVLEAFFKTLLLRLKNIEKIYRKNPHPHKQKLKQR